jgi:nucleoside-diphosphate-sugar epimerase
MINIVGGSGFIGSALCRRLQNSKSVSFSIIDKNQSLFFPDKARIADVRNISDLEEVIEYDSQIINLAAEHRDDVSPVSLYQDVNVTGALNVCNAARKKSVNTIIFTSSVAVYGFAHIGTSELGKIAPFNEYGRTKYEAEQVYKAWQAESPTERTLVIVRPTVVFGEGNRGNVFNLLKQIASGKFVMVGAGQNRKSMAYVENVAAFLEHALTFTPGLHMYNYIDKPDFTMNALVSNVNQLLGMSSRIKIRLPYLLGLMIGNGFDLVAKITGRKFPISAIRVKKFCANSVYESSIAETDFVPPVPLMEAIKRTVMYEFIEDHSSEPLFFSE